MKKSDIYPSKYLKADVDFEEGDLTLTIKRVEEETLGQAEKAEQKPVAYFREITKGFAINKTNWDIIESMHGEDSDDWVGKKITLYQDLVQFGAKKVPGIRVLDSAPAKSRRPLRGQQNLPIEAKEDIANVGKVLSGQRKEMFDETANPPFDPNAVEGTEDDGQGQDGE